MTTEKNLLRIDLLERSLEAVISRMMTLEAHVSLLQAHIQTRWELEDTHMNGMKLEVDRLFKETEGFKASGNSATPSSGGVLDWIEHVAIPAIPAIHAKAPTR